MTQDQRRFPQEECMYCGGPIYQDSEMHVSMHDKLLEQARLEARAELIKDALTGMDNLMLDQSLEWIDRWGGLRYWLQGYEARAKLGVIKDG